MAPIGLLQDLTDLVMRYKIHPILVNFTSALVPVSIASDVLERLTGKVSLRPVGWWTMLYAAAITPLTALSGWLFWMKDDEGVRGMAIHKWLGTAMPAVVIGLALWRVLYHKRDRRAGAAYLVVGLLVIAVLVYQGSLGGAQVFSGM